MKNLAFLECQSVQGGTTGSPFWDILYKIEEITGLDLPTPDDYKIN
ncbi:hypothetical protein GGR28_001085 [Lewinella aquimaris]|uniref:Uncharacterized protein n=1 Tax=Neolewinella aquimaris TaxID=1835722 RepID=A0A840E402_9BACT|nr:hypothetical protein [Neolewinella aquimaris]